MHHLQCQVCGMIFEAKRRTAITCSAKCRQQLHRWRRADKREVKAALLTIRTLRNGLTSEYFRGTCAEGICQIAFQANLAYSQLRDDYGYMLNPDGSARNE